MKKLGVEQAAALVEIFNNLRDPVMSTPFEVKTISRSSSSNLDVFYEPLSASRKVRFRVRFCSFPLNANYLFFKHVGRISDYWARIIFSESSKQVA